MSPIGTFLLLILISSASATDSNVGTVLFTKADTFKQCWATENIALLTSRMILEDLLPSTTILVIDCDDFVTDLVEYFRLIMEVVREESHGKTKHITLMALTDLLGGYLYHAVLPIAKYSFYAGLIDYDSIASLLALFNELKWFLRTDGQGWSKPLPQNMENFDVQKIALENSGDEGQCKNLLIFDDTPDKTSENAGDSNDKSKGCSALIPLPFFDSITKPSAMALPTKTCPLHNLEANSSSYLIMKFFVSAYRCLQGKGAKLESIEKFQQTFCGWVDEQIMPRLADDRFYAAFGGILRVRITLKRLGVQQHKCQKELDEFSNAEENLSKETDIAAAKSSGEMSRTSMILFAVLITIFVWFLLGASFICYRMRVAKKNKDIECSCSSTLMSSKHFFPEAPKSTDYKGTSSGDTDATSTSEDRKSRKKRKEKKSKGRRGGETLCQKFTVCRSKPADNVKGCRCGDEPAVIDSNHTEGRLPSITELSEQSTPGSKSVKKISFPDQAGGSTTASSTNESRAAGGGFDGSETQTETTDGG